MTSIANSLAAFYRFTPSCLASLNCGVGVEKCLGVASAIP